MAASGSEIKSIFGKALTLSPSERSAYLQEACAGAPELLAEVEALLKAHQEAGSFLQEGAPGAGSVDKETWERIDPFVHM